MQAEIAVESLLEVIERSGVIGEDQMQDLLKEFRQNRLPPGSSKRIAAELVARGVLTRWQADQLLHGKHRGFFLGPYRILDLLGSGGMGKVYLAEHQMMRRRCAIKILPAKESRRESSNVDRFYREAQAVAALDHANIVRAYDVNKTQVGKTEIHYLVMEYVEGEDLQRMVEKHGVLDYWQAADFVSQAALGLTHAHERGLVHRDIKPANLIVDPQGVVKILDLGLAYCFDDDSDTTDAARRGEGVAGTADYLAPEQAIDSRNVDARADIYSLGHTFYFLLTGHPPFPKGTVPERLIAHQTKSPTPIHESRPDAPAAMVAAIDKMTAKKPASRYSSAKQVVDVLDTWLAEHGGPRGPRPAARRVGDNGVASPPSSEIATDVSGSALEDTELELAPLEEDERRTAKRAAAAARKTDPSIRPRNDAQTTSDSRAPQASPADSSGNRAKAADGGDGWDDLAELAPSQSDLVALLSGHDLSPEVAVGQLAATPLGVPKRRRPTRQSAWSRLIEQPAFWFGLAAVVVVVLIVGVVLNLPSNEQNGSQPPEDGVPKQTPQDGPPVPPPPPPGPGGSQAGHPTGPAPITLPDEAEVIVPVGSTWKWLHPTDGVDPATGDEDFHSTFFNLDYDDSQWQTGQDVAGSSGGFGYGDEVQVAFDEPERIHRKTAYFRHRFNTDVPMEDLVLSLQRDDGVIVYLDGQEVGRDNVGIRIESYDLHAREAIADAAETEVIQIELTGALAPGEHVLAISLHNRGGGSSDLRIAEISLHGVPADSPSR